MAKNTANGESQTESTFPPEPVVLPPDPMVAAATDQPQQQQEFNVVDEGPFQRLFLFLLIIRTQLFKTLNGGL